MAELSSEVVAFLSEGTRTGMLGFVASDGRPLLTPVWFAVEIGQDGGQLVFTTGRHTPKCRALERDPRVTICVDDPNPPYSFVAGCRGAKKVATITDDPQEVLGITTRTGARYMGAGRADEFGRRNAVPVEVVIRVNPTKFIAGFDISD